MLYSYLLVENPFSLESNPSAPTKEKRFAYSLYLDLLYLLARVAKDSDPRSGNPLVRTRFIRNILSDERINSLEKHYREVQFPFEGLEKELSAKIKESGIYKTLIKQLNEGNLNENIWKEIFELIVMTDPAVNRAITLRENYTLKGVDRMRKMMEDTFSNFFASADNIHDALKVLETSMKKTRELYFRILALPIAITTLREREIDNAQYKLLRNADDINPNLRFVENEFVNFLRSDYSVQEGIKDFRIDWLSENEGLIRTLLKVISQSEIYGEYLAFPATDFKTDCELWRNLFRQIIFIDNDFLEAMEDASVFWNDDLDVIGTFILKSIKKLSTKSEISAENEDNFVLKMFKDKEDAEFGAELFSYVIREKDYYRGLILENVDKKQWEAERLAFMDTVILMTALAEIMNFPKIPLSVTVNEYIEIAKYYSTPKSGVFINGLLGKIIETLREKGIVNKTFNNDKKI